MKMSFRWYGLDDPVKIEYISQIPEMNSIVSAVYSVPVGQVWPMEDINKLKEIANKNNLNFDVVESIPIHEDIKLKRGNYLEYIKNYKENIKRCAKAGVKVICYNFMPVFDWLRTTLDYKLKDGSSVLAYFETDFQKIDPNKLSLPGWDSSYKNDELQELISSYKKLGHEGLWENLEYFLKEVIPVAVENNILMAIHPDDPPWDVFGIPRIITNENNLDRFLKIVDVKENGLTFCTGSLGVSLNNNIPKMLKKYIEKNRVHFIHLRNVKVSPDRSFYESGHISSEGSLDFNEIVKVIVDGKFNGYLRPDHGRFIWGETGKPGYGLYDRALGAMYINGLYEAHLKNKG